MLEPYYSNQFATIYHGDSREINHFSDSLPASSSWLVWDKLDGLTTTKREIGFNDQADAELGNKEEYLKAAKGILEEIEKEKKAAHEAYKHGGDSKFTVKAHSARLVDLQYVVNRDEGKKQAFVNYLKDYVEHGVLVFCAFHDTVDIVSDILSECRGVDFLKITGLENDMKRKEAKEWFCGNPKNKVLIISKAGGQSLNLQATSNILFFDIPFGAGSATQAFG